ncbi:hypothetical protein EYF80_051041 [Liparis tanakae]|uniref:Uncharacterized protein n=1 Tax=Liparis tanakae TaxID=230148 RepID=A0A4Z2FDD9_9TELE|nr:hypothetical protein EYF80_051041 [Liparis tanakae]
MGGVGVGGHRTNTQRNDVVEEEETEEEEEEEEEGKEYRRRRAGGLQFASQWAEQEKKNVEKMPSPTAMKNTRRGV